MGMPHQAAGQELAAGWMRDPSGRHFGRYWDGKQWTDHVISATTVPSIDRMDRSPEPGRAQAQESRTAPASTQKRLGSWKSDPSGRHFSRYWDGERWTEHVMSAQRVPTIDPVPRTNLEPDRTQPAPTAVAPVAAPVEARPPSGVWAWVRSAPWAVAVIVVGLIVIGVALGDRSSGPTKAETDATEPVATTAPSAASPLGTTIPLTPQATITVPGAPADAGVPATTPATTPGTVPGSQSPVTSAPAAGAPPAESGGDESSADPPMSTTS